MKRVFSVRSLILAIIIVFSIQRTYAEEEFDLWIEAFRKEARKKNISQETFAASRSFMRIDERVLRLKNKQPEFTQTLSDYLEKRITPTRIQTGQHHLEENGPLLKALQRQYGVDPRVIVALWGLESNFGQYMGSYPIISSLTTLAFSSSRGTYFRNELIAALQTVENGHTSPAKMVGSWAGAMGQCQFMPWNYKQYAVDYDVDGKRDIWTTRADALASIANFLRALGWNDDLTWGRPVLLPPDFDSTLADGKTSKSLRDWDTLGIRRLNGTNLPERSINARLLRPARAGGKAYLIYDNFDVLMKWNRSHYFVISVGTLSDQLRR